MNTIPINSPTNFMTNFHMMIIKEASTPKKKADGVLLKKEKNQHNKKKKKVLRLVYILFSKIKILSK